MVIRCAREARARDLLQIMLEDTGKTKTQLAVKARPELGASGFQM